MFPALGPQTKGRAHKLASAEQSWPQQDPIQLPTATNVANGIIPGW